MALNSTGSRIKSKKKFYIFPIVYQRFTMVFAMIFILFVVSAYGQTGPGGVGNQGGTGGQPWNVVWYDASTLNLFNGNAVNTWTDLSGNGYDATQATSQNQPVFVTNTINGKSVVRFDGTDDYMSYITAILLQNSQYTVISVAARRSNGFNLFLGGSQRTINRQLNFGWRSNTQYTLSQYTNTFNQTLTDATVGTFSIFSGWQSLTQRALYQNSGMLGTVGGNGNLLGNCTNPYIGSLRDATGWHYFDGDIAELVIYKTALNNAQRIIVENYLSAKYNLTLAQDDYYSSTTYTKDLIGVGTTDGTIKHSASADSGGALYLSESGGSLNETNEFVLAAHDGTPHGTTSSAVAVSNTSRWTRSWYIERSQGGTINAGTTPVNIAFDVNEAGFGTPTVVGDYKLLYRAAPGDNFTEVTATASINGNQVSFAVTNANFSSGYYTLGIPLITTWYTYQTGNWDTWTTWTTDPSGTLLINPFTQTPTGRLDNVIILNGRDVTVSANNKSIAVLDVRSGGVVDFGTTTGHNFNTIKGAGRIKLAADNFPGGDNSTFIVSTTGGTVEFYGTSFNLGYNHTFNNMVVNMTTGNILTLKNNLTVNGDLTVQRGTFRINNTENDVLYNVEVFGNVTIDNGALLTTGTGDCIAAQNYQISVGGRFPDPGAYHSIFHQFIMHGNFTNNGTARFTSLTAPVYNDFPGEGAVTVRFTGTSDNTVTLNGTTDFYNLVIDKGTDRTYELEIFSTNVNNFVLFGANRLGRLTSGNSYIDGEALTEANPEVRKALWIRHGTLNLTGNINIPTLTEMESTGPAVAAFGHGAFFIGTQAGLWINSSNVSVYSTADNISQVPPGSQGLNTNVNQADYQCIVIQGSLKISDGYFGTRNSGGILYFAGGSGQLYIEGGIVNASQFRSSAWSSGLFSYIQTGGIFEVRGRNVGEPGNIADMYALFSITDPDIAFNMSGGEIVLKDVSNDNADPNDINGFQVESTVGNYNVTGGKLTIQVNGNNPETNYFQLKTIPNLYNLDIENRNTTNRLYVTLFNNLTVSNDLLIDTIASLNTTNYNVTIGGDFTLGNTGNYNVGNNTTTFQSNGGDKEIIVESTTVISPLNFYNLVINHPDGSQVTTTVTSTGRPDDITDPERHVMTIQNDFTLNNRSRLQLDYYTAELQGDLFMNSSELNSIYCSGNSTKQGKLIMNNATAQQNITWTNGGVNYLEVDNTNGLNLNTNIRNIGVLEMTNGIIDIHNRIFHVNDTIVGLGFSASKMIRTDGNASDGGLGIGISKDSIYTTSDTILFPVGVGTKYTPAKIVIDGIASTSYNNRLTVTPVDRVHPAVLVADSTLNFYWKVNNVDYYGGTFDTPDTTDIRYFFHYLNSDLPSGYPGNGGGGDDGNGDLNSGTGVPEYVPAYFTDAWTNDDVANVDGANNMFYFDTTGATLNGFVAADFTIGNPSAVDELAVFKKFYSKWGTEADPGNWKNDGDSTVWMDENDVDYPLGQYPDALSFVYIQDYIKLDTSDQHAMEITIMNDGTLDVDTTHDHSFGVIYPDPVTNRGTFKISSANLPDADFNPFNSTTYAEFIYYDNGLGTYTLPSSLIYYPTLEIQGSEVKTLPAVDLTIQRFNITNDGVVVLNSGANGDVYVNGRFLETAGTLRFPTTGTARMFTVNGTVQSRWGGLNEISVAAGGTVQHTLEVYGDMDLNRGTFDFYGNGGSTVNVYLKGTTNAIITNPEYGSNPIAGNKADITFNRLIIDKGTSQTPTATVQTDIVLNGSATGANKPLNLLNGTFILNDTTGTTDITLSSDALDYTIPATAALIVYEDTVRVTGTGGLILDGKLGVGINGSVFLDGGAGADNFIEYSVTGNSVIEITDNAQLVVGSQIRRETTVEAGILKYYQGGTSSVIVGKNSAPEGSRGVFEVVNTGSLFNHTGGTLTIARAQTSAAVASLYLNPATSSLTSSAYINMGGDDTPASQEIGIYSSISLKNVRVNNSSSNDPTAKIWVVPLTIDNDFTIDSAATFNANNFNVTINGNFANPGTYTPGTNTTTFSGTTQTLSDSTDFYHLVVNPTNSLTLQSNTGITVNGNLTISSGQLIDNGNTIVVLGDVNNSATLVSNYSSVGGIKFTGTTLQELSGVGAFGRIEISNTGGVNLNNNISLTNNLILTSGVFYINDRLVYLGLTADIEGAPFDNTKMIVTNGVISDQGITKAIDIGVQDFIFPIGVSGKYTPFTVDITSNNTQGVINVKPINQKHPTIVEMVNNPLPDIDDPNNVLQYYWDVTSTGISNFSGTLSFEYLNSDVRTANGKTEADYIAAQLLPSNSWNKFTTTNVDETQDSIFISVSSSSDISGEYTAGVDPAIPDVIPTYTSANTGNWNIAANWTWDQAGSPTSGPNGAIVIIQPAHNITLSVNQHTSYKTTINGTLSVGTTFGHSIGKVYGTGTIAMDFGTLPAGNYDNFFKSDCSGGSMTYGGSTDYTMSSTPVYFYNLTLTGTGKRILPSNDITVCNALTIGDTGPSGPTLDNSVNNNQITILGGMSLLYGAFSSGTGANATVLFQGASAQTVGGFTGTNYFNNLEIDNANGLTLDDNVAVNNMLVLTNGNIITSDTYQLTLNEPATASPVGGQTSSFVEGPLKKIISNTSSFNFPVGKAARLGNVTLENTSTGGAQTWLTEYFNNNPGDDGYSPTSFVSPLETVSQNEYWRIRPAAAGTARVKLRWDSGSDIANAVANTADLRVAQYIPSSWNQAGGGSVVEDYGTTGTVRSTINVSCYTDTLFTMASVVVHVIPTADMTAPDVEICADGTQAPLTITLTGSAPWDVIYTIDSNPANNDTITNIASNPYILNTSTAGTYSVVKVTDAYGFDGTDLGGTVTVIVNALPIVTFSSNDTTICAGTSVTFTAGGGTNYNFQWNGVTVQNGASTTYINSSLANGDSVKVFVTNASSCMDSSSAIIMQVYNLPTPTLLSNDADNTICVGDQVIFTAGGGDNYEFKLNGATVQNSALTTYTTTSLIDGDGVKVVVTNANGCVDSTAVIITTVVALPTPTLVSNDADNTICIGSQVIFTAGGGSNYEFKLNNATVQNGASTTYTTTSLANGDGVKVIVTNINGCVDSTAAIVTTVNPLPTPTLVSDDADDEICAGTSVTFTATGGPNYTFKLNGANVQSGASDTYITSTLANGDGVKVVVTDGNGCIDSTAAITTTVNPLPNIALTVSDPMICNGTTATITVSNSIVGTNYQLRLNSDDSNVGSAVAGTGSDITFNVNPSSTTVYNVLAAIAATSCSAELTDLSTVTVNPLPNITLTVSDPTICNGATATITVNNSVVGTNYQLRLDSDDSNVGSAVAGTGGNITFNVSPTSTTIYNILATIVASSCSAELTDLSTVTVNPLPDNTLTVDDPTICNGATATITLSNSIVGTNYQLRLNSDDSNVGSAVAGTGADITFNVSPAGTTVYNVLATIAATSCSAELTDLSTVTVNPLPNNTLAVSDPTICNGATATITVSNSVLGVTYQLRLDSDDSNVGSGVAGTGGNITFNVTPVVTTIYNVLATIDATSCSDELADLGNVTVNPLPDNTLTLDDPTICNGATATITLSNSIVGTNYQLRLDSDDSNVGSLVAGTGIDITFSVSPTSTTVYNVLATIVATSCSAELTDLSTVTVNPLPNITLAVDDPTICNGATATITVSSSVTGTNYQLRLNSDDSNVGSAVAGTGGDITFNVTPAITTVYNVLATIAATSCSAELTDLSTVTVNQLPNIALAVSDPTICNGATATITVSNSVIGTNYQLRLDSDDSNVGLAVAGTGADITFNVSPTSTTVYNVLATIVATSCIAELTDLSTVTVNPLPDNTLTVSDPTICNGATATIAVSNSVAGTNYQLRLDSDDSNVGSAVAGTGGDITFNVTPAVTTVFNVFATIAATSCSAELTDLSTVTVNPLPAQYNVTGGGAYCSGGAGVTVGLDDTDTGIDYELYRGGVATGNIVSGTDVAISFGNQTLAATYTVVATNNLTSCTQTMTGNAVVTINPLPTATLSGDTAICDGGTATLTVTFTGTSPYNFTYTDGTTPVTVNNVSANPYNFDVTPAWTAGAYSTYNYTITNVTDANTCSNTGAGSADVIVNKIPETGKEYHIGN